MKLQLTFSYLRIISKHPKIALLCVLSITAVLYSFFPTIPLQLSTFDQQGQIYPNTCPQLSAIKKTAASPRLPSTFTLLNWNIYKQQNATWQENLQLWSTKADLITLQEAKHGPELIRFSTLQQRFFIQNYAFKHDGFIYGVNTLSKTAPQQVCSSRYTEPWTLLPKTAIATTYVMQDSQQSLLLINLHGVNFTFTARPLIEQLSPYLTLLGAHKGPIIISGDFNTWSEVRLAAIDDLFTEFGLREVSFSPDNRLTVFNLPLDHVYFRGLTLLAAQSLKTTASDHNPQLMTFSIDKGI